MNKLFFKKERILIRYLFFKSIIFEIDTSKNRIITFDINYTFYNSSTNHFIIEGSYWTLESN